MHSSGQGLLCPEVDICAGWSIQLVVPMNCYHFGMVGEAERKQESPCGSCWGWKGCTATASHLICSGRSRLLSLSMSQYVKHFIPCQLPRKSIVLPPFTCSLCNQGTGEQTGVGAWAPVSQDIGSDLRGWLLAHLCSWLVTADSCGRQSEKGGDRLDVKKKKGIGTVKTHWWCSASRIPIPNPHAMNRCLANSTCQAKLAASFVASSGSLKLLKRGSF